MNDQVPVTTLDPSAFRLGVPHARFAALRARDPVCWVAEADGPGYWAVTRHADVVAASADPQTFSSWAGGTDIDDPGPSVLALVRHLLVNTDPPAHARLRAVIEPAFAPQAIARLRARLAAACAEAVNEAAYADRFDLAEVASDLAVLTLAEVLGVPEADRWLLGQWADQIVEGGLDPSGARAAMTDLFAYADGLPWPAMTGDQRRLFLLQLLVASIEPTRALICGAGLALIEHPVAHRRLRHDPSLVPQAVEEAVRWVSPVIQHRRTATSAASIGGQPIEAGDKVVLWYASANRDAGVFADPDRFDPTRDPNPHVGFGSGIHSCLGAPLARLATRAVVLALVMCAPRLELDGQVEWAPSPLHPRITSLPVRLRPG